MNLDGSRALMSFGAMFMDVLIILLFVVVIILFLMIILRMLIHFSGSEEEFLKKVKSVFLCKNDETEDEEIDRGIDNPGVDLQDDKPPSYEQFCPPSYSECVPQIVIERVEDKDPIAK